MNTPQLPKSIPAVFEKNGVILTNSRDVAAYFGKRHADVLRAIDKLECSEDFYRRNFASVIVEYENGKGGKQEARAFDMTKDGFGFLAFGFTGKEAAKFKEAYISQFNEMKKMLLEQVSPVAGDKENPNLTTQHQVRDEALNMVREMLPALRQELLEGLRPMSRDISLHSLLGDVSTGQGKLLGIWEDLPTHHIQWPDKSLAQRHEYVVLGYWAETRLPTVMRLYAGNWIIASQLAVYLHPDFRFVAAFEADAPMV
jgi:Rha family phage regulatory protein